MDSHKRLVEVGAIATLTIAPTSTIDLLWACISFAWSSPLRLYSVRLTTVSDAVVGSSISLTVLYLMR